MSDEKETTTYKKISEIRYREVIPQCWLKGPYKSLSVVLWCLSLILSEHLIRVIFFRKKISLCEGKRRAFFSLGNILDFRILSLKLSQKWNFDIKMIKLQILNYFSGERKEW